MEIPTSLPELQDQIAASILAAVDGLDWKQIKAQYRELVLAGESNAMKVTLADGQIIDRRMPTEVSVALGIARRSFMLRPGTGTWYSADITAIRGGSLDLAFNYDQEPTWNIPRPPSEYLADQARYPREDRYLPVWHPARQA